MANQDLLTDVANKDYYVSQKANQMGFSYVPCLYNDPHIIYDSNNVQEIITAKPICLVRDEALVRKLIGLHIRIKSPIEMCSSASAN